jgi:hypothetical protein
MSLSSRIARIALSAMGIAAMATGCSPPGAINEREVLETTPHSEPAEYAKSVEDYNKHMIERYTGGAKAKSIPAGRGKPARKQ